MSNDTIAKTIIAQMGGFSRLGVMVGAYNFTAHENGVSFRIKVRGAKANYAKITLNSMDTYDLEFVKIHGTKVKPVAKVAGIYNDQLIAMCEKHTGLAFRL